MTRIFTMSGSLRAGSSNTKLLRALQRAFPQGVVVDEASMRGVPLYDGDVEHERFPAVVADLKDRLAAADGVLIATPEYNNSVPGTLKNAFDWMSRPAADLERVFAGTPAAVVGATTGRSGTRIAQTAWIPIFMELGLIPFPSEVLHVGQADTMFDDAGNVVDAAMQQRIDRFATGFAAFVARHKRTRP
jgi:chromate reductase, NAD(P)H dehydrogenase (quinone)